MTVLVTLLLGATLTITPGTRTPAAAAPLAPQTITNTYLPVVMKQVPSHFTGVFIPFTDSQLWTGQANSFVALTSRKHAIYLVSSGWGCPWAHRVGQIKVQLDYIRSNGGMPLITWLPMDCSNGGFGNVNALGLPDILNGSWNAYIDEWATDIAALGYPVFVRWGHEMNIPSYSWAGQNAFGDTGRKHYTVAAGEGCGLTNCYGVNGVADGPERYVNAYRYVHDRAEAIAPNIIWVWNPNSRNWPLAADAAWNQFNNYYPGDAYVDWVALDGYNWGDGSGNGNGHWAKFTELFGAELSNLQSLYPSKPQMIAEIASVEDPNNPNRKADFIRDAYSRANNYPNLKALIWVHDNSFVDGFRSPPAVADFRINSSPAALQAYKDAIGSWASNAPFP